MREIKTVLPPELPPEGSCMDHILVHHAILSYLQYFQQLSPNSFTFIFSFCSSGEKNNKIKIPQQLYLCDILAITNVMTIVSCFLFSEPPLSPEASEKPRPQLENL